MALIVLSIINLRKVVYVDLLTIKRHPRLKRKDLCAITTLNKCFLQYNKFLASVRKHSEFSWTSDAGGNKTDMPHKINPDMKGITRKYGMGMVECKDIVA